MSSWGGGLWEDTSLPVVTVPLSRLTTSGTSVPAFGSTPLHAVLTSSELASALAAFAPASARPPLPPIVFDPKQDDDVRPKRMWEWLRLPSHMVAYVDDAYVTSVLEANKAAASAEQHRSSATLARHAKDSSNAPVILTCSTVPWRMERLAKTLPALLDKLPERFSGWINVPWVRAKDGTAYPAAVPLELAEHPRITVHRVASDMGPITKLLPTLDAVHDPRVLLVVIDDDIVYPPAVILAMTNGMAGDTSGFVRGTQAYRHPVTGFAIVEGFAGIVIPRAVMTHAVVEELRTLGTAPNSPCFTSDDYVISVVLARHHIPVQAFSLNREKAGMDTSASDQDPRGLWNQGHLATYNACRKQLHQMFGMNYEIADR